MPAPGRKPKPDHLRRNRNPRLDWTEVPDRPAVPFPKLGKMPKHFNPLPPGSEDERPDDWPESTLVWWEAIATMPHAILWGASEWQFAYDTALMVAAFHCGQLRFATEVRNREKVLGTNADYRRDLRIRYVDPDTGTEVANAETATVTAMADYQRMVDDEG